MENIIPKYEALNSQVQAAGQIMVFATLPGINFDQFNKATNEYTAGQNVVDKAIPMINDILIHLNMDNACLRPKLANAIHVWKRGHYIHKYKRMPDGLHPDVTSMKEWATILCNNAVMIKEIMQ